MLLKYFVFVIVFNINYIFTNQLEKLPLKSSKNGLRERFKPTTKTTIVSNITDVSSKPTILYEKWSKWSPCRNCRKTRRKACVVNKCQGSILYEEQPCHIARCRRKNRNKNKLNIVQKIQLRELNTDDRLYKKWSEWSTCSKQCITRRHRYCKTPYTCLQNPDVQMAYCYKERTACHNWIQNILNKQTNNKKYTYDTEHQNTDKKNRKRKLRKPRKCGIANRATNRYAGMMKIMGGRVTGKSKWPWHVAIINWYKEVFCGGTLIASNWVLTAAHCLRKILYVRLNEFDITIEDGSEIEYYIKKKYTHPYYNASTVDNDIALLKLPKAVPLPYACLPTLSHLPTKTNCTTVGWGRRSSNDFRGSKYLREAQMPIVPQSICKRSYRSYFISSNMFCAGFKNGGIDTCSGDSGGGFMCPKKSKMNIWTVQGITSFGEGCGKKGKYGIYTDVRKYLPWIKQIINKK